MLGSFDKLFFYVSEKFKRLQVNHSEVIYIITKTKSAGYKTERHGDAASWPASGLFNLPNTSLCDIAPVEE